MTNQHMRAAPPARPAPGSAPGSAPRARPPIRLLIAALLGLALALAVVAVLVFTSGTGSASVAAQQFCDALVRHDYAPAYNQLSQALRQEGTEAQFAASQQELDRLNGGAFSCRFSAPRVRSDHATFTLTLMRAQSGTVSGVLGLVREQGAWRVDAYDANVI
ncbi:MAG TPA: hypothetical protein VJO13_20630 [Ktedonobacterales bacterium]|nr:hypothetical protein [Ktedonobacterales bacterium]